MTDTNDTCERPDRHIHESTRIKNYSKNSRLFLDAPSHWGVSNTKCCFYGYAGNCIYGHPNSRNIVVVRIFYFHRDPFAFWGKPFPFQFHSRFAKFREKEIQKTRKKNFVIVHTVHANVRLLRASDLDFKKLLKRGVSAETEDARIKFC